MEGEAMVKLKSSSKIRKNKSKKKNPKINILDVPLITHI